MRETFASVRTMTKTLAALLSLFVCAAALAQTEYPPREAPAPLGPYAGALLGRVEAKSGCIGILAGGGRVCDAEDPGFGIFGGYQFHRHFAAELGFASLGRVRASETATSFFAPQKVDNRLFDLSAVGLLPLTDVLPFGNRVSFFARLGGYLATLSTSQSGVSDHSNVGLGYGGGLQLEATPLIGVRAFWQRYKNVGGDEYLKQNYDLVGVSAFYRFR